MLALMGLGPMELVIVGAACLGLIVVLVMRLVNSKK
jgi:hypothetical protein